MKINEHPDLIQYTDLIKDLIKEITIDNPTNTFIEGNSTEQLPILPEKYFTEIHHKNSSFIGKKFGGASILGFAKHEINATGALKFSCECDCGMFFILNLKTVKNAEKNINIGNDEIFPACEKCNNEISRFNRMFMNKTNKAFTQKALYAIFHPEANISIDNPIKDIEPNKIKEAREKSSDEVSDLTIDDIKWLLLPNNKLNDRYFIFSKEENKVYKKGSANCLFKCSLTPTKMIDLHENKNIPYSFKSTIGKKIFRLTVIGITTNGKELKNRNLIYVCKCDCGLYTSVAHETLKSHKLPTCERCNIVVNLLVRKEKIINNRPLSIQQAWEMLGQNTEIVPIQIENLKSLKGNSYETPRKVYEKETSFEKFQAIFDKRFGLVTAIAKSRRVRTKDNYYQIVCKCDCGNECVFPYTTLKKLNNPYFLACSVCTLTIQSSTHLHMGLERTEGFVKKWKELLEYHEVYKDVNFIEVYNHFLSMRTNNLNLTFTQYLAKLFNHLKKQT